MDKPEWETRLERRHAAPPPEPAGAWERLRRRVELPVPPARFPRRLVLAGAGSFAALLLAAGLWGPWKGSSSRPAAPAPAPAAALDPSADAAPVDAWVEQQWSQAVAAPASASNQDAGAEGGLLDLMDAD